MRNTSTTWETNQLEDVSVPSLLVGTLEARKLNVDDADDYWRWNFDYARDNVISANVTSQTDLSRASMPIESCQIVIENKRDATKSENSDVAEYDFTSASNRAALENPSFLEVSLGYDYGTSVESVGVTRQRLEKVTVDDSDLYVTFDGVSYTSRLDDKQFYGGRYVVGGIPASTLFAEILEDADFPNEGIWTYVLGDANCKVSNTQPLWDASTFAYYHIDPALDNIKVHVPIPVVSHREALTTLAAYVGAYLVHRSDGSLHVLASLPTPTDEAIYTNVYDRPKLTRGSSIGRVTGTLKRPWRSKRTEDFVQISETEVVVTTVGTQTYTITHDPCDDHVLTLSGATLIGTPQYYTYATTFVAAASSNFTATLSGYPLVIRERVFEKTYLQNRGEVREFNNPLASDPTLTERMYDAYVNVETADHYTFTMRDNPAFEVCDRVTLRTLDDQIGKTVIIQSIKRDFNGAIDAEYEVVVDSTPLWVQSNMIQANMV